MGNWALAKTWVKLTTGTHKFLEKFGQREGEEEVYRQFGKKGQREKMGRESLSVSNHLPIAPHHRGEGFPSQSVISLV